MNIKFNIFKQPLMLEHKHFQTAILISTFGPKVLDSLTMHALLIFNETNCEMFTRELFISHLSIFVFTFLKNAMFAKDFRCSRKQRHLQSQAKKNFLRFEFN